MCVSVCLFVWTHVFASLPVMKEKLAGVLSLLLSMSSSNGIKAASFYDKHFYPLNRLDGLCNSTT